MKDIFHRLKIEILIKENFTRKIKSIVMSIVDFTRIWNLRVSSRLYIQAKYRKIFQFKLPFSHFGATYTNVRKFYTLSLNNRFGGKIIQIKFNDKTIRSNRWIIYHSLENKITRMEMALFFHILLSQVLLSLWFFKHISTQ